MIVDKKSNEVISGNSKSVLAPAPEEEIVSVDVPEQIEANGPMDILNAMKEILRSVTWEYGVANSPKIFRTVQISDGQYERIINSKGNLEEPIGFPCAFVHFINWRYLVQANRINEGRAELRIRFIMNRLNNHDDGYDMDVYYVAERIHQTIQESIDKYECLQERCRLEYVDPMESFDHALQPCWMTYEVWFKQRNVWITRRKTYKKIVFPPFANHADQDPEIEDINPMGHTNLDHPRTYNESTGYIEPSSPGNQ